MVGREFKVLIKDCLGRFKGRIGLQVRCRLAERRTVTPMSVYSLAASLSNSGIRSSKALRRISHAFSSIERWHSRRTAAEGSFHVVVEIADRDARHRRNLPLLPEAGLRDDCDALKTASADTATRSLQKSQYLNFPETLPNRNS